MAPDMPRAAGVSSKFGAQQAQHLAPLHRHALRHGEDQAIALGGGNEPASAMPVLPLVGSTRVAPASAYRWLRGPSIMARPMRSFTEEAG